jgi:hypothetical protein
VSDDSDYGISFRKINRFRPSLNKPASIHLEGQRINMKAMSGYTLEGDVLVNASSASVLIRSVLFAPVCVSFPARTISACTTLHCVLLHFPKVITTAMVCLSHVIDC